MVTSLLTVWVPLWYLKNMETTKTVRTYSATEEVALEILAKFGPLTMSDAIRRPLMLGALRSLTKRKRARGCVGVVFARGAYRLGVAL